LEFSFFSQQTKAESLHVYEVRIQKGLRLDSRAEATQAMWTMVGNLSAVGRGLLGAIITHKLQVNLLRPWFS
jgi:hypothetical protein